MNTFWDGEGALDQAGLHRYVQKTKQNKKMNKQKNKQNLKIDIKVQI